MTKEYNDVEIPDNFTINYITMSDGVSLRHLSFRPENSKGRLFVYPGMNTLVLSWIHVLNGVSEAGFSIDYVESREKHTAIFEGKENVTYERMLDDCDEVIKSLGLDKENFTALGSSLGANTLVHLLGQQRIAPKHVILVGPNKIVKIPFAIRAVLPLVNNWTYNNIGKRILLKIIIRKYTNEEADPVQKEKYVLALHLANASRLKKALRTWNGKSIVDDLSRIKSDNCQCHLIGATEDKLHAAEDTQFIADNIHNANFVDLKTNTAAHAAPIIKLITSLS